MGVRRSFEIKRLKPYHREAERMPMPAPEKTDEISELDPNLRPEEQSYVNHYLGYADILLNAPGTPSNVIELSRLRDADPPEPSKNGNNDDAA
jgi:hypothetical protein